jgi:hypothetical protein
LAKAATPARKSSQPGSITGITSDGGTAARCEHRVPPRVEGRGVHKGQGGNSFSPWWPRAVVQALVKKGGAARRQGGRRRQRDDVEAVEAGALDDGGTGSSHGRLQSSRRTAFPRVASNPPSPPTSPSPPACGCVDRGADSPEAAEASYSGGQRGVRGRPRSAWGHGARRDGEAMTGAPRFGFGRQPKR